MNLFEDLVWGKEKKKRKPVSVKLRREIMTRPAKCAWCRKHPAQEIHHIDGNPRNNKKENLIPLCGYCHQRVTAGEITKGQLRRRKGAKKKTSPKKPKTKRRRKKQSSGLFGWKGGI